ncbi:helix-turn-helix domain-containing protein [Mycolicibacterium sp. CBMA 226]|uniref:helix-turn-helix domain-containing protein n=1 Tax=Mycolicibacterium sp. CBMA 226 TaxID=2606611 RepID=UPI001413204A|nr:helix-turn-helix transcriptional regulator [Mycolicibacterium sp. CBMA 226]
MPQRFPFVKPEYCSIYPNAAMLLSVMESEPQTVREAVGGNVARIRKLRGLTVRELSAALQEFGLQLSASGVSDIENVRRKVTIDELLILAVALNTSAIDLLTPANGGKLVVADEVGSQSPVLLEQWLRGDIPWPETEEKDAFLKRLDAYLGAASEYRRAMLRRDHRSEIVAIHDLEIRIREAMDAVEDGRVPAVGQPTESEAFPSPEEMASSIRKDLEKVVTYVELLADQIEKNGYGR